MRKKKIQSKNVYSYIDKKVILFTFLFIVLLGGLLYHKKINSDEYRVKQAIKQEMSKNIYVKNYTIKDLRIKDGFARAKIISPGLDTAGIVLQNKNANWEVVWGPATGSGYDPIFDVLPKDL